jgi:hypothetical protein
VPTQIRRLGDSASLLPAQSLRATPKCAYELRKSGLMARVGSVTMVRTPAGHTNVFSGRRSMAPVVPNARRVRTSSARTSLEDTHTTGPGCRRIARILHNKPSLRLVVLNSCEGARTSNVDPFSGVATTLIEFGIPAVIGMQFEITDEAAIAFSASLYRALAQGLPVDAAIGAARCAIVAEREAEFGTPVLFLRAADARLFDLESSVRLNIAAKPVSDLQENRARMEEIRSRGPPELYTEIGSSELAAAVGHVEPSAGASRQISRGVDDGHADLPLTRVLNVAFVDEE